jgi:preprotein translocase subunit SecA
MQPVYQLLGLTVGCVVADSEPDARRQAYASDITYATSREVGFDFLRDRMKFGVRLDAARRPRSLTGASDPSSEPVQRGHHFALVDEADSVLIDDASTPMILSVNREMSDATREVLYWSRELASQLREDEDFHFDRSKRVIELTNQGVEHVIRARKPPLLRSFTGEDLYVHVEQALQARHAFQRNRDYVIAKDEITIVDERTGRPQEGRKWQAGLHQAIEAKELVPLTDETAHGAAITVQTFFRRYEHLAGMTGTAVSARAEFRRTYRLAVTVIPTNRPCLRAACPTRIFTTQEAKRQAMVPEIERLVRNGRSVLIGTPSVHASEALGQALNERGLACQILNARFLEQEAEIVAQAGESGRITIATNMAGRGTDIHLSPAVRDNGGLHVIATELHTNRRVDRQLVGRAARQGDPGSYQFWLSLEDELLRFLPVATVESLQSAAAQTGQAELPSRWIRCFQKAQRQAETLEQKGRRGLLDRDLDRDKSCRAMGLDPYLETPE